MIISSERHYLMKSPQFLTGILLLIVHSAFSLFFLQVCKKQLNLLEKPMFHKNHVPPTLSSYVFWSKILEAMYIVYFSKFTWKKVNFFTDGNFCPAFRLLSLYCGEGFQWLYFTLFCKNCYRFILCLFTHKRAIK